MAFADIYPEAEWLGNGKVYGEYLAGAKPRLVWHTTETSGLPGYNEGAIAPHLTYDPETRKWYQHAKLSGSIGALRDTSGGTRTNRQGSIQVEIIAYSAKGIADQQPWRQWVGDLSQDNLKDLGLFGAWLYKEWGVPLELHPLTMYITDGRAYGADSPTRMSIGDWESRKSGTLDWGWCSHRNVPENTHWDTGALDIPTILMYAQEASVMATFNDVPESDPFFDDVEWLAWTGITYGVKQDDPSTPANEAEFGPDRPVTRKHMAAFLHRFANAIKAGKI